MRSALYYTNTQLDFYSAGSLKQSADRHVVPLGHIILIPSQFSGFSWREQVKFQWYDDEVRFVLDHHA